jgi:tRNA-2-methylthio-N6-dimethylallyladenosine synthase
MQRYFIKTFGCQQNVADSERLASYYEARGMTPGTSTEDCDVLILNTCVIRDKAEERVYGQMRSLEEKLGKKMPHVVVTGCLIGSAAREPSGKMMKRLTSRLPGAEILPLEDIGFEYAPKRKNLKESKEASVVISNGCNNYCAFCIVPFARGKEISRPYKDILEEVAEAVEKGFTEIMLLGQNVNSYGADFLMETIKEKNRYTLPNGEEVEPVMVQHLGRHRIPTLFTYLLRDVARTPGVEKVTFLSSNPWDFSEELIAVMAENKNINRVLHLPVQAGSNAVIKRMNRWYTREEYLALIAKLRAAMPEIKITTDIIVGFPGETLEDFEETKNLISEAGFVQTFIAWYSPRPGTAATRGMVDDVPIEEKKRRFRELDALAYRGESYY